MGKMFKMLMVLGIVSVMIFSCDNNGDTGDSDLRAGGDGQITVSNITADSVELSWASASDATSKSKLDFEYLVAYSLIQNIDTVEAVEDNATFVGGFVQANSIVIDKLETGKTYYFNVVVRNAQTHKAAYKMTSAATQNVIFMFSTTVQDGNRAGRNGLDTLCDNRKSAVHPQLPCQNIKAFVGVNGVDDYISNFPSKWGVPTNAVIKSAQNGNEIASDWNKLMSPPLDGSLNGISSSFTSWWSGSDSSFGFDATNNCAGWTMNDASTYGRVGNPTVTDSNWYSSGSNPACNDVTRVFLCICW